jgi:predicted ATPase
MGAPLESITIEGYKSIRSLVDFPLQALNVLIGANGSGKSNFLSVFRLINRILGQDLQTYVAQNGGADNFLYFGKKTSTQIVLRLAFPKNGYACRLVPTSADSLVFAGENVWFQGLAENPTPYTLGNGQKETRLVEAARSKQEAAAAQEVLQTMRSWTVYHFHDTSPTARLKQTVDLHQNEVLAPDGANLAAFLYRLQATDPTGYQRIVSTVRMVAPFFGDFALRPNPLNPNTILLRWRERGAEMDFGADLLSDGSLRFICLATLLLQPELPATILIDEPELGLHPYAINLLAALLKSAATRTQVIVSTQSVTLVNQFEPQDIVVVDRQDEQSNFKRYSSKDLEHWLDGYGMGDLWEKNVLGGRPK